MNLNKKGFTLIEMLLVLAIIGILVGAVFVMLGNSNDAKTKSALSTTRSIMPYVQECYFKGDALNSPSNNHDGGGVLCSDSQTFWPKIGPNECNYEIPVGSFAWNIICVFSGGTSVTINCEAQDGECVVN